MGLHYATVLLTALFYYGQVSGFYGFLQVHLSRPRSLACPNYAPNYHSSKVVPIKDVDFLIQEYWCIT